MCWSLEVSAATFCLVVSTCVILYVRNKDRRDRGNMIFMATFGSMQLIDALLWYHERHDFNGFKACDQFNQIVSKIGIWIVMAEPTAALATRCYVDRRWPKFWEMVAWPFLFVFLPSLGRWYPSGRWGPTNITGCDTSFMCTQLTNAGHLVIGVGRDPSGGVRCWTDPFLIGTPTHEIPLILRIAFLGGMLWSFKSRMPAASGFVHCAILTATWVVGLFSDSHASMWCMANVAHSVFMLSEPYVFPLDPVGSPVARSKRQRINEDRYTRAAVPDQVDCIVIGSGIGGLTTAAMMARAGKRVLVLEQHYRAGGCTHTFDEVGVNIYDSGIHYVGSKPLLDRILSYITDWPIEFRPMGTDDDEYTYDEFDLGDGADHMVKYRTGKQRLMEELLRVFPHERAGLQSYFRALDDVGNATDAFAACKILPDWLLNVCGIRERLYRRFMRVAGKTAAQAVREHVTDPKLVALLSGGQLIDWNLEPDRVSWYVTAAMMRYYFDGGYYPAGGSHRMAESIIPVIERAGGRVLCRAPVQSIVIDSNSNRAIGVLLKNGDQLNAPLIISDAGAVNTFEQLLPVEAVERAGLEPRIPLVQSSHGHMTCFVCLDGPATMFDLRPANIHSFEGLPAYNYDISAMQRDFYARPFECEPPLVTLTCPAAKDPLYGQLRPGTSNVLLLTEANYKWFSEMADDYSDNLHGNRTEKYKAFKKRFESIFLNRLYRYYPKCRGHVIHVEIGTPLTSDFYLATTNGASYGLEWTVDRFDYDLMQNYLSATTKIPGLYLTGEASFFGGLVGAMVSGMITATKILGFGSVLYTLATITPMSDSYLDRQPPLPPPPPPKKK